MPPHRDLVAVAAAAAQRAAAFIREAERPGPRDWDRKEAADFVTQVDRESERLVRDMLLAAYPDSAVMGEELSPEAVSAELVWIVDPLDGTTNYLHGYPAYAVSIAARWRGELVAGVVLDVDRDVCYSASTNSGAALRASAATDDTPLRVSAVRDPANALLGTGFPFKQPALRQRHRWNREFLHLLYATSGIRRAGSAALDLVDVARGRFDGFWEYGLAPWDAAAGIVLILEAGGRVTDLEGHAITTPPEEGPLVAGNPAIHEWLLDALRRSGATS